MDGARTSRVEVTKQASALATMQQRGLKIAERLEARRDKAQALESALLQEQQRQMARRGAKSSELREIASQLTKLRKRLARSVRNGIRTAPGGAAQAPPAPPPPSASSSPRATRSRACRICTAAATRASRTPLMTARAR